MMSVSDMDTAAAPSGFDLRPEGAGDRDFLLRLFADIRSDEMAQVPWPAPAKQRFLEDQFRLQHQHYHTRYRKASFHIVEVAGQPAGRLYLARDRADIRIIDVSLLAPFRRRGIGQALLGSVLDRATAEGRSVSLHVAMINPARNLYLRLGFQPVGSPDGINVKMVWTAPVP